MPASEGEPRIGRPLIDVLFPSPTVSIPTITATIYVGLRERYDGTLHTLDEAHAICQEYCDTVGLCVTCTPTRFIYKHGSEPGAAIGLINYPRFPSNLAKIKGHALELADKLRMKLGQLRVSVVFPDETVMLSNPDQA